ncbi:MAG TPA: ribosome biogenesis GTPase Der [Stellaceae bacterium]|jgi:GTP-binding protein|nr:ribosome biogenesis GTPase Der [Stellaceae bacterium]
MDFTVAILGRPNVGKSTLFNRLVGRRTALVDDVPGVTRDRREGQGRIADLDFRVIDTAGLEEAAPATLAGRMRAQTERSIDLADVVLLVIDAREGITDPDRHFGGWLRRGGKPVVLIANKAEGRAELGAVGEAYALGLGDPVPISALNGEGFAELYDRLRDFAPLPKVDADEADASEGEAAGERPLQLAIVGRPNVGKSTLVNRLVGEDRLLTGPEPGITRDAISLEWEWRGRPIRLVDTAGLRRRAHVQDKLERLSVADTLRTIRFAGTVVLVLDALEPFGRQDLTIANMVAEEGRALVLAANKWDAVADKPAALRQLRDRLTASLAQLQGVTLVPISGLAGSGLDALMKAVVEADAVWNKRLPTPVLNRWLAAIQQRHPPPLVGGRRLKLRYMTQANTRPPTFALFAPKASELPDSYRRYLVNALRQDFGLPGTPIRLMLRKGENPYVRARN